MGSSFSSKSFVEFFKVSFFDGYVEKVACVEWGAFDVKEKLKVSYSTWKSGKSCSAKVEKRKKKAIIRIGV